VSRRNDRFATLTTAFATVLLLAGSTAASAQDVAVTAGVDVRMATGTFGTDETTHLVYAPAVIRVRIDRFELSGYFPYVSIDNGTVTFSQGGFLPMRGALPGNPNSGVMMGSSGGMHGGVGADAGLPGSTSFGSMAVRGGLGDVAIGAGYRVVDDSLAGLEVVLSTRVKIPTASADRGLGTGRTDIAGLATVRRQFTRGWIYVEAGYVYVGKLDGVGLSNAALWGVGAGRQLTRSVYLIASAAGNTAVLREFGAPVELGAGLGFRLGERAVLSVLPGVGLTDASPRYVLSIGIRSDLLRR